MSVRSKSLVKKKKSNVENEEHICEAVKNESMINMRCPNKASHVLNGHWFCGHHKTGKSRLFSSQLIVHDNLSNIKSKSLKRANMESVQPSSLFDSRYHQVDPIVDLKSGVFLAQGKREYMEDRVQMYSFICNEEFLKGNCSLYLLADGHGGAKAAEDITQKFQKFLYHSFQVWTSKNQKKEQKEQPKSTPDKCVQDSIRNACESWQKKWELWVKKEYEKDSKQDLYDGCTFLGVFIHESSGRAWIFNVGDSKACVLKNRAVICETVEHKPSQKAERDRLIRLSNKRQATVTFKKEPNDVQRVNGILAMTRAMGECCPALIDVIDHTPDIFTVDLIQHLDPTQDPHPAYIVLASDGLWDVMTTERMNKYITNCHKVNPHFDVNQAAREVVENCLQNPKSEDNISCILIRCSHRTDMMMD